MNKREFNKLSDEVIAFAELNEIPQNHWVWQALARANRYFQDGEIALAEQQLDNALVAAQTFGTNPRDYRMASPVRVARKHVQSKKKIK